MPHNAWQASQYWLAAGWTMFQFLGIGFLLWIFGGLLRWALRRAQPQVRYAVALGLLLTTAAVPAGLFVTALDWAAEVSAHHDRLPIGSSMTDSSMTANIETRMPPAPTQAGADKPPNREQAPLATAPSRVSIGWKPVLTSRLGALRDLVRDWGCRWLPWLWLVGTPLTLVVLACGVSGADRLRRAGRLLHDGDVVAANERLRGALQVGRQVAIIACDRIAAPILVGILRPAILLPPAVLAGCSPEQIEMILLHELAHVRRYDNLVNVVQRVIEAALFFHPVVWWLSSWVRLEREECCDRVVVAHTGRPQAYAETLAWLALPGITPRLAAATMADCHLVTRIRHILNLEDEVMNISRNAFVAAAGLLISIGCIAASFAQQPKEVTTEQSKQPPVGDPVGASVPSSSGATTNNTEALLRAIDGSYIQEIQSGQIVEQGLEIQALDIVPLQGLHNPLSATQHGLHFLAIQQSVAASEKAAAVSRQAGGGQKWGPEQATGAPNSPDYPNNQGTAWCPATADGQEEWLELTYGEPVEPLVLVVYECLKPGALTRVIAFDAEGNELNAWSGKDPSPVDNGNGSAISVVPLKLKKITIVRLRLYFDSPHVEGWNEIDAVGILDVRGTVHWATGATASSTWVDQSTAATSRLTVPLSDAVRLDYKVNIIPLEASTVFLKDVRGASRVLVTDPNVAGLEVLGVSQQRANEAGGGDTDRVTLFEERIKKLEADLAGLREALQQLKPPAVEKAEAP